MKSGIMFTFLDREEGLLVLDSNGRGVAHVDTKAVTETNDPNFRVQKRSVSPLPVEEWRVHFTGTKLSMVDLEAFVSKLKQQAK